MEECLLYTLELCCNSRRDKNKDRKKSVNLPFNTGYMQES